MARAAALAGDLRADAGEVGWPGEASFSTRVTSRLATGEGAVLSGPPVPFHDAVIRPAEPGAVRAWLHETAPPRAVLPAGELRLARGVTLGLDAGAFNRHTFLCGQSGSGKTYALGVLLERLLLETRLRVVILDPNSDFVRLGEVRAGVDPALAERYRAATAGLRVQRGGVAGSDRLRFRLGELDRRDQAAALQLDPIADREEYAELVALLDETAPAARGLRSALGARRWCSARATSAWTAGASGLGRTRDPRSMRSTTPPYAASSSISARSPRRRSRRSPPRPSSSGSGAGGAAASRC